MARRSQKTTPFSGLWWIAGAAGLLFIGLAMWLLNGVAQGALKSLDPTNKPSPTIASPQ